MVISSEGSGCCRGSMLTVGQGKPREALECWRCCFCLKIGLMEEDVG